MQVVCSPFEALRDWVEIFVDFLVTKHGLADMLQSDSAGFSALHAYFLDRLVPTCASLLDAAAADGEIKHEIDAYELMRGIGNLCIGRDDPRYDPRRLVDLLLEGAPATTLTRAPGDPAHTTGRIASGRGPVSPAASPARCTR